MESRVTNPMQTIKNRNRNRKGQNQEIPTDHHSSSRTMNLTGETQSLPIKAIERNRKQKENKNNDQAREQ
jgi:hypothetical protein